MEAPKAKSAPRSKEALFTTDTAKDSAERNERKDFCTLQAKFAMVGHTLYRTVNPDGTLLYLAGKWGYFREMKGLEAVAAFLSLLGGVR